MNSPFLVIASICTGFCVAAIGRHYLKQPNRDKFQIIISNIIFYSAIPSVFMISYLLRHEMEKQNIDDMISDLKSQVYEVDGMERSIEDQLNEVNKKQRNLEPMIAYLIKCRRLGIPKLETTFDE